MERTASARAVPAQAGSPQSVRTPLVNSVYESLLSGEDILVLQRAAAGRFRVVGAPPGWVALLEPKPLNSGEEIDVVSVFLFLSHFLEDAEQLWRAGEGPALISDIWSQMLENGEEQPFTATARIVDGEAFLLISALGVDFEERRRLLQKARELALAHERLLKEISKKEALLHCLVHDVAGPATAMSNCFELLNMEPALSDDGRGLVKLGLSEVKRQQILLRATLDIFAAELNALEHFSSDTATAPDVLDCLRSVKRQLNAGLVAKGVLLAIVPPPTNPDRVPVTGSVDKLERVLYNLLENAIRHTPVGSTVMARIDDEGETIRVAIDDQGVGILPELEGQVFGRFRQGPKDSGKAGIGLFFCHMMIKRWGGEIGCETLDAGGSRFWFRLPKPGERDA